MSIKEENASKAKIHTLEMYKKYENEIKECIKNSKIYTTRVEDKKEYVSFNPIDVKIAAATSSDAIRYASLSGGKTAVLNFASYKNPGGGFLDGMTTQEEALCHDSFLYNVIAHMKDYYVFNNKNKNRGLYLNRAIYSPDVIFFNDVKADVITCASPNWRAAAEYCNVPREENNKIMKERVDFIFDIAEDNGVETLILGAWGCGVFAQNPSFVAELFSKKIDELNKKGTCIRTILFPIPAGRNLDTFLEII